MPQPSSARRVFERQVTLAYYRWEFLRRNPDYQQDVRPWLGRDAEALGFEPARLATCEVEDGVIVPPFDYEVNGRYLDVCARWGVRLLVDPKKQISAAEMAAFPIFEDTPRRQPSLTDEAALRRRVWNLPDHTYGPETRRRWSDGRGPDWRVAAWRRWLDRSRPRPDRPGRGPRPGGPGELLEDLNREDHERAKAGRDPHPADISERDLRRYFRTEVVPRGPFQLRAKRLRFPKLEQHLKVFDLHEAGKSFFEVAQVLRVTVKGARRYHKVARQLIGLPRVAERVLSAAVENLKPIEQHFPCEECDRLERPCPTLETALPQDRWLRESLSRDIEGRAAGQQNRQRGVRSRAQKTEPEESED